MPGMEDVFTASRSGPPRGWPRRRASNCAYGQKLPVRAGSPPRYVKHGVDCSRVFLYYPRRPEFTKTCQPLGGLAVTECSGIAVNAVMLAPRYRRRLL